MNKYNYNKMICFNQKKLFKVKNNINKNLIKKYSNYKIKQNHNLNKNIVKHKTINNINYH